MSRKFLSAFLSDPPDFIPTFCPNESCSYHSQSEVQSLKLRFFYRYGYFKRENKRVQRFKCRACQKTFCASHFTLFYRCHRRSKDVSVFEKFMSLVSHRRIALTEGMHRETVARREVIFGKLGGLELNRRKEEILKSGKLINSVMFDEMESFIHTKLKPVSIPLCVNSETREILGITVCEMPAKGPLASLSVKKYGKRKDERKIKGTELLESIAPILEDGFLIQTDKKSDYPKWLSDSMKGKKFHHKPIKGHRGYSPTGQGELRDVKYDPLFSLNHTTAMIRANISRLIRKTWCTSKDIERLYYHLMMYTVYHNNVLIPLANKQSKKCA